MPLIPNNTPHGSIKRIVLRGTVGAFIVRSIAAITALAMNITLARMLDVADYGVVALGLSWLTIAGTIACFGTDTVSLRFVAEGLAKGDSVQVAKVVHWGGRLSATLGLISALASVALATILFHEYSLEERWALWIIVSATPFLAFSMNRASVLRGEKKIVLGTSLELLLRPFGVLLLAGILFVIFNNSFGVIEAAAVIFVVQATIALVGALKTADLLKYHADPGIEEHPRVWLRTATPIAAMSIMTVVMNNIDTIVVGYYMNTESAGIYRANVQLASLVAFGLAASNGIVAPMIAELYSRGAIEQLRRVLRYSILLVSAASLIGVAVIALYGFQLLGLFGAKYQAGYHVLLIMLIGQTVNALCGPTSFMMSMTGHQNFAMKVFAISAIVNLTLNILLVQRIGLLGGAIANVSGLLFWNVTILIYLRTRLGVDSSLFSWWPVIAKHLAGK